MVSPPLPPHSAPAYRNTVKAQRGGKKSGVPCRCQRLRENSGLGGVGEYDQNGHRELYFPPWCLGPRHLLEGNGIAPPSR